MVEITFGMALDGAKWADGTASIGKMTCGPMGMLKFLETRLGLGGVEVIQAERISAYLEKARAVYGYEPNAWGAESFGKDEWTTAKRLLALRDELIGAGWDGKQGGSDRLDLLAKIEAAGSPTLPGLSDRVKQAVQACSREQMVGVTITVVDDLAKYPHHWRELFSKLEVKSSWEKPGRPDIHVEEVNAANEFQLAGLFLDHLKAKVAAGKRVSIIADGDTGILDGFLRREGLPTIGRSQGSVERAAMQILPLWIEYMWEPFSPMTLLEILKSEVTPFIPGVKIDGKFQKIGLRIVEALREAPGIGGEAWVAAWDAIGPDFAEYRTVLEAPRFDPEGDGIPIGEFEKRIDWLIAKLGPKVADDFKYLDDHIKGTLKGTIRNANDLKTLARSLEKINRVTIRRLLGTIVASGTKMPDARREVAPWQVCKHAGQIASDVDCVFWWNFSDCVKGDGVYWTNEERQALGAEVDFDTENSIARESDRWYNALVKTKEELRLYHPMMVAGDECAEHPFRADLIRLKYLEDKDPLVQEDTAVEAVEVKPSGDESVESNVVAISPNPDLKPSSVSASQLTTLLSCPFKWYFEKHIGLRQSAVLDMPRDATMIGLLAHKVVETIINVDKARDVDAAVRLAAEHFDELVSQMAAVLDAPEHRIERDHHRRTLVESVKTLWTEVADRGLRFVEGEKVLDKEAAFNGINFIGRADIVLEDSQGNPFVIDLKWSSGTHYIDAADNGRSVQLATYAWAIDPLDMNVRSAYYMFPKKYFYPNPQDDKEVWRNIETDYSRTILEMRRGELSRGYEEGQTRLGIEPPCNFCQFKSICGKERA